MRQLNFGSVRGTLTGLRQSLPSVTITRRRAGAGAAVMALLGCVMYALRQTRRPREVQASALLRCVTEGPEGYLIVRVSGNTFLAPVSQRAMIESFKGSSWPMPFMLLAVEPIDGLRVGTLR